MENLNNLKLNEISTQEEKFKEIAKILAEKKNESEKETTILIDQIKAVTLGKDIFLEKSNSAEIREEYC